MLVLALVLLFLQKATKARKKPDTQAILSDIVDSFAKSDMEKEAISSKLSGNYERAKEIEDIIEKLSQMNASNREYRLAYEDYQEKEDRGLVLKIYEMIMNSSSVVSILSILADVHNDTTKKRVLKKAFNKVFADIINSSELNLDKERIINSLSMRCGMSIEDIQSLSNYNDYIKTLQVQDILQGHTTHRFTLKGIPINLQKNETPIWAFNNTDYYEEKTKRTYVGGSSGLSIRLAKGIYYRVGAFRGETVVKSNLTHMYNGNMVLTDKNIYFFQGKSL